VRLQVLDHPPSLFELRRTSAPGRVPQVFDHVR
jgi:hypothetical protein